MFKKCILMILKPLSFLPAIVMMYVIFSFSAQTGTDSGNLSYTVSHKIVEIGNEVLQKNMEEWEIEEKAYEIEYQVREIAHMTGASCATVKSRVNQGLGKLQQLLNREDFYE